MMHDSMNKKNLDKTSLFQDYISRYKYDDINKASEDFEEIYEILEIINYAIQINRFNGHPRGDLEGEVTAMFSINHFTDTETNKEYCEYNIDKICDLLNEYDDNLRMSREKALYWRNKAKDIFGDMKTNVELQRENIRLKKELEKKKMK